MGLLFVAGSGLDDQILEKFTAQWDNLTGKDLFVPQRVLPTGSETREGFQRMENLPRQIRPKSVFEDMTMETSAKGG